jgi:hypothetical protein
MASEVDICSAAVLSLGGNPISSFDESTDRARLCASLWPLVRDEILRGHPWNCAIKRDVLAALTTAPAYDYAYQYELPSDWLRTLSVGEYGVEPDFKTEGRRILSDETPLKIRYIFRNEDSRTYDALLVDAMIAAMAARIAYAITQSASLAQVKMQELQAILKRARAVDGMEDPPEVFGDFPLLASRHGAF